MRETACQGASNMPNPTFQYYRRKQSKILGILQNDLCKMQQRSIRFQVKPYLMVHMKIGNVLLRLNNISTNELNCLHSKHLGKCTSKNLVKLLTCPKFDQFFVGLSLTNVVKIVRMNQPLVPISMGLVTFGKALGVRIVAASQTSEQ